MKRGIEAGLVVLAAMLGVRASAADPVPIVLTTVEVPGATVIESEAEGDSFLDSAVPILAAGDIDGDGIDDLAFAGATAHPGPGESKGYILFGAPQLPVKLDLAAWESWGIRLFATNRSPCPRADLGDLDGDGLGDLAFESAWSEPDIGQAIILFGSDDLPRSIDADSFESCRIARIVLDPALEPDPKTPYAHLLAFAGGDLDGDGKRDLVVSTTRFFLEEVGPPEGLVYIVFGQGAWPAEIRLADVGKSLRGRRLRWQEESWGGLVDEKKRPRNPAFGESLLCADFDRDGLDDLAVQAPYWLHPVKGAFQTLAIVFGRSEWPEFIDLSRTDFPRACHITAEAENRELARYTFALVGDLSGDGGPDLLVSAHIADCRPSPEKPDECTLEIMAPPDLRGGVYLIPGDRLVPGLFRIDEVGEAFFLDTLILCGIGDFDGDGPEDLAVGDVNETHIFPAVDTNTGAVKVFRGKDGFHGQFMTREPADGVEILGPSYRSYMGSQSLGADLDGDGRDELVVTAPGLPWIAIQQSMEGEKRGRLFIFHGEVDFLGRLSGFDFVPGESHLSGGSAIRIRGNGFDAGTEVFLGETPLDVVSRHDSRIIVARVPPSPAAGPVVIRLRRGSDEFVFAKPFEYYGGNLPRELDVDLIGASGCAIYQRPYTGSPFVFAGGDEGRIFGGADFSGDGLADVIFAYTHRR